MNNDTKGYACACMGPQVNPETGKLFPKCPCKMEYTEEEKAALALYNIRKREELHAVLKRYFNE